MLIKADFSLKDQKNRPSIAEGTVFQALNIGYSLQLHHPIVSIVCISVTDAV